MNPRDQWLQIYTDLHEQGKEYSPRGQKTVEIEDYQFEGDPYNRLANFAERNLSLKYICGEFLWYLSGDRDNTDIVKYSKFWDQIKNAESPLWNSNYGFYIFKEGQFDYALAQLTQDPDTRQAAIVINRPNVMMSESKDKICTYSMSFRIRDMKLNMSVNMRSNDFVLGTQIDYFQFAAIQEMMLVLLREKYPDLEMGVYRHKADSFHIYERHFPLMLDVIKNNQGGDTTFVPIEVPKITNGDEAKKLMSMQFDDRYPFTKFVLEHAHGN
jgi:thymidylate synthase